MTTKKPEQNGPEPGTSAASDAEDPMTSFEPGQAKPGEEGAMGNAERASGTNSPPAEPARQGNGSERTVPHPGGVGEPSAPGSAQDTAAEQSAGGEQPEGAQEPDPLEEVQQELGATTDRLVRLQAEFENYKKRIQKEHADSLRYALTPLVTEVAAIMDNLERAVEHARKDPGSGVAPLLEGVEMVVRQMQDALGRFGVTRIEAVGKAFDPSLHEAINVVETQDVPENQVVDEYQAGYLLHDRVVRPARVSVSKRAAEAPGEVPPAENQA